MSEMLSLDTNVESIVVPTFSELGLRAELLKALKDKGYETPTPVQAAVIPLILQGEDVLAGAQTGTGKTAGFTLPLLQRLMLTHQQAGKNHPQVNRHPARRSLPPRPVRALVLAPTRELVAQVEESVRLYGSHLPLVSTAVFGGVNMNPQIRALARGADILVATPGRLLDHVGQRTVDLSQVEIFVLDEADRMLDMGFVRDIRRVLDLLPEKRQNLLFSATFDEDIKRLADDLLNAPKHVEVGRQNTESPLVTQTAYMTQREHKRSLLVQLIRNRNINQALVFTRTKHGADRLAGQLEMEGISTATIHSNRSQLQRTQALHDFKAGSVRILVATDIAARGLDIQQLPFVVNFDLPNVPEDYVHRIGRTGRAGSVGEAISLVSSDEHKFLAAIERLLKKKLDRAPAQDNAPGSEQMTPVSSSPLSTRDYPAKSWSAPQEINDRSQSPRSRPKKKIEVQWGQQAQPKTTISAKPRHKRKPASNSPGVPVAFERFRPRTSRNG